MAGVMPKTALLLTRSGVVQGEYASWYEIAVTLGISIGDDGHITFMGEKQNPGYVIDPDKTIITGEHWERIDAIKDWAKCYMEKKLPSDYRIYRFLKSQGPFPLL